MTLEMFPDWFRATPAGKKAEEERERVRRNLHDRIVAEMISVERECDGKERRALVAKRAASAEKAEKSAAVAAGDAAGATDDARAVRSFDRRNEKRLADLQRQLLATSDERYPALADVLDERCTHIRMGRLHVSNAAAVSVRLSVLARECREAVPLLAAADAAQAIAKILAEVSQTLIGETPSSYDYKFLRSLEQLAEESARSEQMTAGGLPS